ncbi:YqaJ viral recombinase family protein [Planococcus dechangensis]|uniref:YqaJ viral recombinase family protein n=1 Tax=Planococcus dechangensis TaxID=1176255 RepID=A0ABV9M8X3_9BACL
MRALLLADTRDLSREEWLEQRKKGIGGSDVSAIAGLNKWKSPVGVYLEKLGQSPEEDTAGEAAYWGNVMEDIVAQEFTIRTGIRVRKRNAILQHPKHSFMLANVDRLIVGKEEGLECKTASEYLRGEWEDEEVPAAYLLQCQHYMAVTGYKAWHIAVLVGGNKFIHKKIERDEELIQYLIDIEEDFWVNHVLAEEPPVFDGSDASSNLLKALYPEENPTSEIKLGKDVEQMLDAIDQLNEDMKICKTQKQEYENQIKAMMGENEKGFTLNRVVKWKSYQTNKLDTKSLKADHPKLYKQYTNTSTARRFTVQ